MNFSTPEIIVALVAAVLGLVGIVLGMLNSQRLSKQVSQQANQLVKLKEEMARDSQEKLNSIATHMREQLAQAQSTNAQKIEAIELEMGQLAEYFSARRTIRVTLLAAASRARHAVNSLVSTGINLSDPSSATPESAGALQAITSFFATLNDVKYRAYLNGSEVSQLGQVSQALSRLYLSLDIEAEEERESERKFAHEDLRQAVEGLEEMFLPNVQPMKLGVGG